MLGVLEWSVEAEKVKGCGGFAVIVGSLSRDIRCLGVGDDDWWAGKEI